MASFFIDRPVFAWVISIIIMLGGIMALNQLPVSQYPNIAPPTISVTATYSGATAKAIEDSVTQVIEQEMTGLDGLDYVSSTSSSAGTATITITFKSGTDPDIAQVQVQNKLSLATPRLPEAVQRQGVIVDKANSSYLLVASIYSSSNTFDQTEIGDYVRSNLYDPISRVEGVGSVQVFGAQYAMRIWLNPEKLQQFNLLPSDVVAAVQTQNTQISAGELGASPAIVGQEINVTITLQSLLNTPDQFRNILLRSDTSGGTVKLSDVARVEMGAQDYSSASKYNGYPAAGFAISMAAGANALDTAEAVKAKVAELSTTFPTGLEYAFPVDTTPFIEKSVEEVEKTLLEAIFLVFIVIFIFLQSIRASIIPMIAVPVVLLGTVGVLFILGFSLNTLTLFAMVLAIGLLVDDAIVVVENVERVIQEEHLSPIDAARKSMKEITGALVGIAVVLSAVFIPMAFFPGSSGVIYKQFSVTIVSAMGLSVVIAIVLTPALCATILKPHHEMKRTVLQKPADLFNVALSGLTNGYETVANRIIRRGWLFMGCFVILVGLVGFYFVKMPSAFLPNEDQGNFFTSVQLPATASAQRTSSVMDDVQKYFAENERHNVKGVFTVSGFSFAGSGANNGMAFVALNDWSDRTETKDAVTAITGRANGAFFGSPDAQIFSVAPPPIRELGNSSGFDLYLKDASGLGHQALLAAQGQLLGMAAQNPKLVGVRPNGLQDGPQLDISLNHEKVQALNVSLADATNLISTVYGGRYVNDFLDRGRVKRVYVQGDAPFRMQPDDLGHWYVRNTLDQMIPLEEIASEGWTFASPQLQRYSGVSALNIQGNAAPGESSGAAMEEMETLIQQLPDGFTYEWSGLSRQEKESGNMAPLLYAISFVFVFLCLAALYESWTVPIAVLLVAPLGVAGAVLAANVKGLSNDIFFQVGLITTVGLASKNAILIVEFAKQLEEAGVELVSATIQASKQRLRPILMTSFAFGFGVIPLATSTGAGAAARVAIGTTVLGGLIGATLLGLIFAPLFYVMVRKLANKLSRKPVIGVIS